MSAFEPEAGVYNERTSLAWQRTALALVAGSAIVARLTLDRLGPVAVASLVLVLPLALWVMLESRGRYTRHAGVARPRSRGGRAPTALVLATVILALTELAAVVVRMG